MTEWQDRELEITLDSGACENVIDSEEAPGYLITESVWRRRGQNFVVGDGGRLPNECQVDLVMSSPVGDSQAVPATLNFQVAGVSRPLMSVAKVCAKGHTYISTKDGTRVVDEQQKTIAQFKQQNGWIIDYYAEGASAFYQAGTMSISAVRPPL